VIGESTVLPKYDAVFSIDEVVHLRVPLQNDTKVDDLLQIEELMRRVTGQEWNVTPELEG
jgi:hypothetical protein